VARVLNVLPDGSVVLDRQQLFAGPAAYDQARRAGVTIESPLFATNLRQERLLVRPARDAAFVVWYPGEGTLDVSPSDVAAMTALSSGEFAHLYASDGAKRASLSAWGGWVTVADGRLTSFVELNSP
jgi:hypothetical protein